jgi:hypothetical protein
MSPARHEHESSLFTFRTEYYVLRILLVSFALFQGRGVNVKKSFHPGLQTFYKKNSSTIHIRFK